MHFTQKTISITLLVGITVCLVCLATFLIPSPNTAVKEKFALTAEVFSFLVDVATLIIALILFDRYGLDKKIIERRQDAVLELIDLLYDKTLIIEESFSSGGYHLCRFNLLDETLPSIINKDLNKLKIVVDSNFMNQISAIVKYRNRVGLPKKIKRMVEALTNYEVLKETNLYNKDPDFLKIKFIDGAFINISNNDLNENKYGLIRYYDYYKSKNHEGQHNNDTYEFFYNFIKLRNEVFTWLKVNTELYNEMIDDIKKPNGKESKNKSKKIKIYFISTSVLHVFLTGLRPISFKHAVICLLVFIVLVSRQ